MKKLFFISVLSLAVATNAFSQETQPSKDCEGAFPKGSSVISAGVGFGAGELEPTGFTYNMPVNPTLTWDMAITRKLGIGNIGVGLILSTTSYYLSDTYGNEYYYTANLVGARFSYHFIIPKSHRFDPYVGFVVGYLFGSAFDTTTFIVGYLNGAPAAPQINTGETTVLFGGFHFYFSRVFGVTVETGLGGFSFPF